MRNTSIQAYREIVESGSLSTRRLEVYDALFSHGPLKTREIWANFFKEKEISQNSINPRLSELKEMGIVEEVGEKACSITGKNCILWDVTANLPKKLPKQKTRRIQIKELEEENKKFKKMIHVAVNTLVSYKDDKSHRTIEEIRGIWNE
jgi:hypothetical protein